MLVYDEKVPKRFWRIAIVTGVLPSRDSEIRGAIVWIVKTNANLKHPVNILFTIKNIYDTNQTDKVREPKLRWEAAIFGEHDYGEGEESFNITNNNLLIKFNKTKEIFPSVAWVLSILLTI